MNASVNILTQISAADHERVQICRDDATGLHAIIALHSTRLGPALGGVRMWHYASGHEALSAVLRHARNATYKSALAGLNLGGGSAVIVGDRILDKSPALLRSFGRFVNDFAGKFVVAGDTGLGGSDLETIRETTPYVSGSRGEDVDGPSFTALSVFAGIQAAIERLTGSDDLYGRRILVQGTGRVGLALVKRLCQAGATVYACDIRDSALRAAVVAGAQALSMREVFGVPVDVYAPCASGATLNPATISQLRCRIVAGGAESQLLDDERDSQGLRDRGILHVPDFVTTSGGQFAIAAGRTGCSGAELGAQITRSVRQTARDLFTDADTLGLSSYRAAARRAETRLQAARCTSMRWGRTQFRYHQLPTVPAAFSETACESPATLEEPEALEAIAG